MKICPTQNLVARSMVAFIAASISGCEPVTEFIVCVNDMGTTGLCSPSPGSVRPTKYISYDIQRGGCIAGTATELKLVGKTFGFEKIPCTSMPCKLTARRKAEGPEELESAMPKLQTRFDTVFASQFKIEEICTDMESKCPVNNIIMGVNNEKYINYALKSIPITVVFTISCSMPEMGMSTFQMLNPVIEVGL